MTALNTLPGECMGPTMVGLVPRSRPTINVAQRDPVRVALIDSMDRQLVIERIARQLFRCSPGNTLQEMYAGKPPNGRWQTA